jgi:hypothetical protein
MSCFSQQWQNSIVTSLSGLACLPSPDRLPGKQPKSKASPRKTARNPASVQPDRKNRDFENFDKSWPFLPKSGPYCRRDGFDRPFFSPNTKSAWRLPGWASRTGLLALLLREENISVGLFTLPLREKHWTSVILF